MNNVRGIAIFMLAVITALSALDSLINLYRYFAAYGPPMMIFMMCLLGWLIVTKEEK